ncbi:MAG: hypothetical protein V1661_01290 [bacterium]
MNRSLKNEVKMEDRRLEEIYFAFADMHLGEGKNNNLEYFKSDAEFAETIKLMLEKYAGEKLALYLLGDTIDFLVVEYHGRTQAEPTENAALEKIAKIFAAHPKVVESFRIFIEAGERIKFFLGNHDIALGWPNVQNFIRRELIKNISHPEQADAYSKRIEFALNETRSGVFFTHENDAEEIHSMPKNLFLTERAGKPLATPLLCQPYGNHSRADLANPLAKGSRVRKGNYWVGRLEPHWYIYLESIWKNQWFALNAFLMWLFMPLRHRCSRRWWVRKSAGLMKLFLMNLEALLLTIWDTFRGRDYTHYPRTILENNNDINIIFIAHIHTCRRETHEKYGTFIYPGNWSVTYDIQPPKPNLKWKHFRDLEKLAKTIWAARKMFNKKTQYLYQPKKRELYSFGVCKFYSDGYKETDLMRYNPKKKCLEKLN